MKKEEKLKIAIDFIADYLSETPEVIEEITEEEKEEVTSEDVLVETESEDNLTRAYTLMKKLEARDIENAKINLEVKKVVNPLKEELKKAKAKWEDDFIKEERTEDKETEDKETEDKETKTKETKTKETRTGVTMDGDGNLIKVEVPNNID